MPILDFQSTPRQAFANGFLKGLAAPAMLYHTESAPALPQVPAVEAPKYPIREAIAGDWLRIGKDMSKVIERYGKAA